MTTNIVVTGTLSFDYIMDFNGKFSDRIMPDKLHCLSLSFLVDKLNKQMGGTAGNIAYSMRLLGMNPAILAPAGNDYAPYQAFQKKHKINTDYIKPFINESTSLYFVMTDQSHNQIGSFYMGATKYAKKLHISDVPKKEKLVILSSTEPVAMRRYVQECIQLKIPYLYDPSFQIGNFTADELEYDIGYAQILIGNDYEIALIEEKLAVSHEELITRVQILITTLGSRGSIIETRYDALHIRRAIPISECDPTGAGDAYRAGFVTGYLKGFPLDVCGQMGSTTAAYTVEKYGTQTHEFTKREFCNRFRENFGKEISL